MEPTHNTIEKLNLIVNIEMQIVLGEGSNKERLDAVEKLLVALGELVKYEAVGMFEAEPSAKYLHAKFTEGKEVIIKECMNDIYLEIEKDIATGMEKHTLLKALTGFKLRLAELEKKATDKDLFSGLISIIDKTIKEIICLPDEIIPSALVENVMKNLN